MTPLAASNDVKLPLVTLGDEFIQHARIAVKRDIVGVVPREFQSTRKTTRETYNFGYNYNDLKVGDHTYTPIPDALAQLCTEAVRKLEAATGRSLPDARNFQNCILSIYEAGYQLQPHIDVDAKVSVAKQYGFYFGEDIIGVVIEADPKGKFYVVDKANTRHHVDEVDGSAFLLSGPMRHEKHGVSVVANRRVSATFRTVEFT